MHVLDDSNTQAVSWIGDGSPNTDGNNDHQHPTRKRSEPKPARGLFQQHHILKRSAGPPSTVHQTLSPALLTSAHGEISLHILDDETGVLVINSFISSDETPSTTDDDADAIFINKFASLATEAISDLRQKGITKIIIDLSGNGGGFISLGQNLAMQFFPEVDHFFGTNMRWSPALATMLTKGKGLNATYWDLGHYRKMDGSDFSSYEEFLGPVHKDDDYFTVVAVPDIVESNAEDGGELPGSYSGPQPFDTDNIVLVSF